MESPMSGRNVKGHRIAKENIISIAVCIVLVTLRFYARIAILRKVRATDYVILLSLALGIVQTILLNLAIALGFGQQMSSLDTYTANQAAGLDFCAQPIASAAACCVRISVALLLMDIVRNAQIHARCQLSMKCLIVFQVLLNTLSWILLGILCHGAPNPITFIEHCSRQMHAITYVQGALNSLTDLWLSLFAANILRKLNMRCGPKLALMMGLCGGGLVSMGASLRKTLGERYRVDPYTVTFTPIELSIWSSREFHVGLLCATIPTLKPLWPVVSGFISYTVSRLKPSQRNRSPHFGNRVADELRQQAYCPFTTTTSVYVGGRDSLQGPDGVQLSMLPLDRIQKAVKLDVVVENGSAV